MITVYGWMEIRATYMDALGTKYYPEPIELVDDSTLIHLSDSFLEYSNGNNEELDILISQIE